MAEQSFEMLEPTDMFVGFECERRRYSDVICDSSQMVTALLAGDPYVSMRPASMMRIGVKQPFKVLPVRLPALPRPVGVVALKDRTLSPGARIFIDCARELTKPLIRR